MELHDQTVAPECLVYLFTTPKTKLEELYPSAFRVNLDLSRQNEWSLEQPSPLKYVERTTTYGVFEAPVK